MNKENHFNDPKIARIKERAEFFMNDSTHSFDHVIRVLNNALLIKPQNVDVDMEVITIAVLLHDIAKFAEYRDNSGETDHARLGAKMAGKILEEEGYPQEQIDKIKHCIRTHRYRTDKRPETIEAKILFDADKIDSLGAIGVARHYMICGEHGQRMYSSISIDEYLKDNIVGGTVKGRIKDMSKHTPNMDFELRAKKVVEELFTEEGKRIAQRRYEFIDNFFKTLGDEVNCSKKGNICKDFYRGCDYCPAMGDCKGDCEPSCNTCGEYFLGACFGKDENGEYIERY